MEMKEDQILKTLEEWNFWNQNIGKYVGNKRKYTTQMEGYLKEREIITLSGPRRAGKSTIMYQLMQNIIQKEDVKQTLYVNFEDPSFLPYLKPELLENIYDAYRTNINSSKKAYLFLDEIQNIEGWEKWVRSYYDKKEDIKFIISGSSSKLLSSEFSSLLTGRFVNFQIFPLSFAEYLEFKEYKLPKKILKQDIRKIGHYLKEYMKFGGFPDMALKKENEMKTKTLEQYFESMIMRDVVERYKIRDILSLKQAAVFCITNISKEFSFNSLRKSLKISLDTAKDYVTFMEQAHIFFQLPYFSYSLKEVMARNRKIYAIDVGLRNSVSKSFSSDLGRLAENLVYLKLTRDNNEIYYWKGKNEVDFILKNKTMRAINVCYNNTIPEREIKSLIEALEEFKLKEGWIITNTKEGDEKKMGKVIRYIPLYKFLLSDSNK